MGNGTVLLHPDLMMRVSSVTYCVEQPPASRMQARRVFFCKEKQDCQVNCRMQARWVAVVVFKRVETKTCKADFFFLNGY